MLIDQAGLCSFSCIRGPKAGKNFTEPRVVSVRQFLPYCTNCGGKVNPLLGITLDGEITSDVPEAYTIDENDKGVGFDEWAEVEKKRDYSRRTPLRINSK